MVIKPTFETHTVIRELTWLQVQEYFIKFSHCESFKLQITHVPSFFVHRNKGVHFTDLFMS